MSTVPTKQELQKTLIEAGRAHHEFQENFLDGVRHEGWAWWYSAFVLGRLGGFTTPTRMTRWLAEVSAGNNWFKAAAEHILVKISDDNGSV